MGLFDRFLSKNKNILDQYMNLSNEGRWEEALPLIEEILSLDESIETSWFNYGVCLEALGRYDNAVDAFKKAYEINPYDKGIQYRIFRALALNADAKQFTKFAEIEVREDPEILDLLQEFDEFQEMVNHKWFKFRMKGFTQQ